MLSTVSAPHSDFLSPQRHELAEASDGDRSDGSLAVVQAERDDATLLPVLKMPLSARKLVWKDHADTLCQCSAHDIAA